MILIEIKITPEHVYLLNAQFQVVVLNIDENRQLHKIAKRRKENVDKNEGVAKEKYHFIWNYITTSPHRSHGNICPTSSVATSPPPRMATSRMATSPITSHHHRAAVGVDDVDLCRVRLVQPHLRVSALERGLCGVQPCGEAGNGRVHTRLRLERALGGVQSNGEAGNGWVQTRLRLERELGEVVQPYGEAGNGWVHTRLRLERALGRVQPYSEAGNGWVHTRLSTLGVMEVKIH